MAFYLNQKQMTRATELQMLRKLHALECTANGTPLVTAFDSDTKPDTKPTKPKESKKTKPANRLPALVKQVADQGIIVRDLKKQKAPKPEIESAVGKLLTLKKELKVLQDSVEAEKTTNSKQQAELRAGLEDILLRKFFYVPSFEIYGGVGGLYDFGPTGCALKANILDYWRQHFVLAEKMLEVSCSALTPDIVLRTSGHVEKFTDFMVKDLKTGEPHRADKLLEDHVESIVDSANEEDRKAMLADKSAADALSQNELGVALKRWGVKAPTTGNDLSDPFPFNLMFVTSIGPTGKLTGYLRPETAQGIFVNFRRLLEYNGGRMPFAAAQIGLAYRNEISPRSGLLRVREFPLAEIEHFCNPDIKDHPKFKRVINNTLTLLPKAAQTGEDVCVQMTVGEAVKNGTIDNETLAYFMARTHMFLVHCGVHADKLRFRQHKDTEMAHYAKDCWDAEILMSYGWVECVGHADRSAYDLQVHSEKSKVDLIAQESYDKPREVEVASMKLNSAKIGKTFGKTSKIVTSYLKELDKSDSLALKANLEKGPTTVKICTGETFEITPEMVTIKLEKKTVHVVKYTPSVVEPSFGVGRIMYGILEHSYQVREKNGEKQGILSLSPSIAPIKACIVPVASGPEVEALISSIETGFVDLGLASKTDTSGASIGRKYARADEIGIPYAITLDFDSVKDNTVTIRDRDTTEQIRVEIKTALSLIAELVEQSITWKEIYKKYPHQAVPEDEPEKQQEKARKDEQKETKKQNKQAKNQAKPDSKASKKQEKKQKQPKKEDRKKLVAAGRKKLLAQVDKEGGKKAQDIAGLKDMGGVSYFHVAVETCDADFEKLEICMKAMNTPCPEDADERRGGAEDIGKVLMSYNDNGLAFYMHVPKSLTSCSIDEWYNAMASGYNVEKVGSSSAEYIKGYLKADPDNNVYPIKVRDDMINKGYQHLAAKKLVMPDDDSDDDMVFGDDDFYI